MPVCGSETKSHVRRMPVIAARQSRSVIEPLLHDGPLAIRRHDERMQIDLESVADAVVVDLGGTPARADQRFAVETPAFRNRSQFAGRIPRMPPASAANIKAQFGSSRIQPAL